LQKIITWINKSGKRKKEWENACVESGMKHQQLKTLVKTIFFNKMIMFEETLESKKVIVLCYG
jgi:hypothetical protein